MKWWYWNSWIPNFTWPIHKLIGKVKCKLGSHFIVTILDDDMKPDYKKCLRCDR